MKLVKEPARVQIVIVFVDLFQHIAEFEMGFVVIRPMLFTACHRYAAVWTLEFDMSSWHGLRSWGLPGFGVEWRKGRAGLAMTRMRAVGMVLDVVGTPSNLRDWRVAEGMEEVVWLEHHVLVVWSIGERITLPAGHCAVSRIVDLFGL